MTQAFQDVVTLTNGESVCKILPALGGSLAEWSVGGQAMLRTASQSAIARGELLGLSSFPLVPYSNRIANAQFEWEHEPRQLTPNFAPEPHAIHGTGWKRNWQITAQTNEHVTLSYAQGVGADWPWAFTAEQTICLGIASLTLSLRARNDANIAVPLAFGHHPYFDQAGASLQFDAATVWMNGADALPTHEVIPDDIFDFNSAAPVMGRRIDNCYTGWDGKAHIRWDGRPHALTIIASPSLPAAVVYVADDDGAFCFEPVPHINNALHLPAHTPTMPIIEPGAWFEAEISFKAVKT